VVECDNLAAVIDGFTPQQCADHFDRFADRASRLSAVDAELGKSRNSGADAEDGASAGDLVECRNCHCRQRRMAGERIGHAGAEQDVRGKSCELAEAGIDLPVEALVRHPHRAVTVRFR